MPSESKSQSAVILWNKMMKKWEWEVARRWRTTFSGYCLVSGCWVLVSLCVCVNMSGLEYSFLPPLVTDPEYSSPAWPHHHHCQTSHHQPGCRDDVAITLMLSRHTSQHCSHHARAGNEPLRSQRRSLLVELELSHLRHIIKTLCQPTFVSVSQFHVSVGLHPFPFSRAKCL